ncbi:MAG: alpha/beta fold hydrolase [Rhodobacteraceae bacterium]|nr:alpha/beta fold hydrolase [Paracoccaceae bacterium]
MIWLLGILICVGALPFVIESRRKPMDTEARKTAPGEFVELSQGLTHYRWIGPVRGPIAVCVHGLTTPSFVWGGLARGLSAMGFRVLVYDLYGRGYSDRPKGPQDRAFFLRQLEDLLDHQDVREDFTLIGYSMGGAIATAFAAAHPDRVRQVLLIAAAGLGTNPGRLSQFIKSTPIFGDWLMMALFPLSHKRAVEADRDAPSSVPDIVPQMLGELSYRGYIRSVLASLRGILREDMASDHKTLHKAGVPVLAIWGRKDSVIPLTAMGRLAEVSRSTRQDVIEDAGHGLTYTHTDQILEILKETQQDALV